MSITSRWFEGVMVEATIACTTSMGVQLGAYFAIDPYYVVVLQNITNRKTVVGLV
jgi:hypothetical protein